MKTEAFDKWQILGGVGSPEDVKKMSPRQLELLAREIREYLSFRVRENGGHLASNLGVVELTIAIHRVFDLPNDHLIFDVGHQSYVHKLLTGRKERFDTLRRAGGISGFTKRAESEYDAFGAGHSSTAISAAIGMAQADLLANKSAYTVAVVGDGALTGGLAYEGLNNCRPELPLLIVINENEMSISPNTGRLAAHLARMRASKNYLKTKEFTASLLRYIPLVGKPIHGLLRRFKRWVKHLFYEENLFEHMGIRYLGPVDGNDLEGMIACLEHAKRLDTSVILHVKTKKGKGDAEAEEKPDYYHGVAPRDAAVPETTFSSESGRLVSEMADKDPAVTAITAAMSFGTGLEPFRLAHPERFFDVGIAEGHAVTFSAGLAVGGSRPFCNIYSSFMQRAYDNVIHDVALQNLPVVLCLDRAGLVGEDGATHHGAFDLAYFGCVPNITIAAPRNEWMLRQMMYTASKADHPTVIRYPRGIGEGVEWRDTMFTLIEEGRGEKLREGEDVAILAVGTMANVALRAAERSGRSVAVYDLRYAKPLDEALIEEVGAKFKRVITIEDGVVRGGVGESVAAHLSRKGLSPKVVNLGIDDRFVEHGKPKELYQECGYDEEAVLRCIDNL